MNTMTAQQVLDIKSCVAAVGGSGFGVTFYCYTSEVANQLAAEFKLSPDFATSNVEVDGKTINVSPKVREYGLKEKAVSIAEKFSADTGVKLVGWLDSVNYR